MNGPSNSHGGNLWGNHSPGQFHKEGDAGDDEDENGEVTGGVTEKPRVKFQQVGCHSL